jgi:hypothetical protein
MKSKVCILVLWLTLAISGSQAAQTQELVIDNFKSDVETLVSLKDGDPEITFRRSGNPLNIIGGVRETTFGVTSVMGGGYGRKTLLDIPVLGPMFLESGVKETFGLTFFYGNDINGNANPLNLDLKPEPPAISYDRFRFDFESCDVELNYLIQVFDGDGNYAILSGSQSTADRVVGFGVEFIFDEFAPGAPGPINWHDIDAIAVLFQTGNATGGADFVVRKIVAVPSPNQ